MFHAVLGGFLNLHRIKCFQWDNNLIKKTYKLSLVNLNLKREPEIIVGCMSCTKNWFKVTLY